jgi:hypothetical protein
MLLAANGWWLWTIIGVAIWVAIVSHLGQSSSVCATPGQTRDDPS